MKATAVAQPNIALIKYWGKQDDALIIPVTGSISMTLDVYPTTTTVELLAEADKDSATLDGEELRGVERERVTGLLTHIRTLAGISTFARVTSTNTVPTAAGLASSASGFAALATAACAAYGLDLTPRGVSRLARRGSGSASRSVFGGVVRWNRGGSDESSFAEPLTWNGPELRMIIARVSAGRKAVSSRRGMEQTIATSPFVDGWVRSNEALVDRASEAVARGDVTALGELTELSTLRMHATMLGAEPPLRYLTGESFALFDAVGAMRDDGIVAYATADAGPNVKILTTAQHAPKVRARLATTFPHLKTIESGMGGAARLVSGGDR